jgi:hypothetical protein
MNQSPPDMAPFVGVQMIEARPFSRDTLQSLVLQYALFYSRNAMKLTECRCFHFEVAPGKISERVTPQWTVLVDFLNDATKGKSHAPIQIR